MIPVQEERYGVIYELLMMCEHEEKERKKAQFSRLFEEASIPERYKACGWDDYELDDGNREAVNVAKACVNKGEGAVFYGTRGNGKTMLASIIANELTRQGRAVLFASVPDLLEAIKARFNTGNSQEVLEAVKTADTLILDDLGAEKMTAWVAEQFFLVINYRYNRELQTIITSNHAPAMMMQALSVPTPNGWDRASAERIMSRLQQMCSFVCIKGKDRRSK